MREGRGGEAPRPPTLSHAPPAARPPGYLRVQLGDKKKGRRAEGDARQSPDAPLRAPPLRDTSMSNLEIKKKGDARRGTPGSRPTPPSARLPVSEPETEQFPPPVTPRVGGGGRWRRPAPSVPDKSLDRGLTFNRSQRVSCSATYETLTQNQVVYE